MTYKFRAECPNDAKNFLAVLGDSTNNLIQFDERGCCFSFESEIPLNVLVIIAFALPDHHVLAETIDYADKFDYERRWWRMLWQGNPFRNVPRGAVEPDGYTRTLQMRNGTVVVVDRPLEDSKPEFLIAEAEYERMAAWSRTATIDQEGSICD